MWTSSDSQVLPYCFFHIKSQLKHSPHVAPGVEPLNHGTWFQPNPSTTQPSRSLVAARLDATVYALDTEQLTLDRAIIPRAGRLVIGILGCFGSRSIVHQNDFQNIHPRAQKCELISCFCITAVLLEDRGKSLRVSSFSKNCCSNVAVFTVDMTVSELNCLFSFFRGELIHQLKSCSSCNSEVHHCIKVYSCNTCRTCCKQPLTSKASLDDMNHGKS